MILKLPFDKGTITQRFGDNANPSYGGAGLKGHSGIDFGIEWGVPIPNVIDSYCYGTANRDHFDPDKYRAVYTIYDEPNSLESYEISYGHCSDMSVKEQADSKSGDFVGKIGNTGEVYVGGHRVTREEKLTGSHSGAHLHFQVRRLLRTKTKPTGAAVYDAWGLYKRKGYYYEIPEWGNGYNGCVDPQQFVPFAGFDHDLWLGKKDTDNVELQKRLGVSPTDVNFGPKTLAAVLKYQKANGIPATGYVGPVTRTKLNAA